MSRRPKFIHPLRAVREALGKSQPQFAKMFGSYVGEVYRKNHGATWGMVEMSGQSFPGLKAELDGTLFWPWGRARNRLTDGAENNVWHYYSELIKPA